MNKVLATTRAATASKSHKNRGLPTEAAMKQLRRGGMSNLAANGSRKSVARAGMRVGNSTTTLSVIKEVILTDKSQDLMEKERVRNIKISTTSMTLIRIMTNIKHTASASEATIPKRDLATVTTMASLAITDESLVRTTRKSPTLTNAERVRSTRKSITSIILMILTRIMTNIKGTASASEATIPKRDLAGMVTTVNLAGKDVTTKARNVKTIRV